MIIIIPSIVGILFIGKYLVLAVYGKDYLLATSTLYVLSLLIITMPLIALYTTILQSKGKNKNFSKECFNFFNNKYSFKFCFNKISFTI